MDFNIAVSRMPNLMLQEVSRISLFQVTIGQNMVWINASEAEGGNDTVVATGTSTNTTIGETTVNHSAIEGHVFDLNYLTINEIFPNVFATIITVAKTITTQTQTKITTMESTISTKMTRMELVILCKRLHSIGNGMATDHISIIFVAWKTN